MPNRCSHQTQLKLQPLQTRERLRSQSNPCKNRMGDICPDAESFCVNACSEFKYHVFMLKTMLLVWHCLHKADRFSLHACWSRFKQSRILPTVARLSFQFPSSNFLWIFHTCRRFCRTLFQRLFIKV